MLSKSGDSIEDADYKFYSRSGKNELMNMQIGPIAECTSGHEIPNTTDEDVMDAMDTHDHKNILPPSRLRSEPIAGSTCDPQNRLWSGDDVIADDDVCRLGELNDRTEVLTDGSTSTATEMGSSQKRFTHSRSVSDFAVTMTTPGVDVGTRQYISHSLSAEPNQLSVRRE